MSRPYYPFNLCYESKGLSKLLIPPLSISFTFWINFSSQLNRWVRRLLQICVECSHLPRLGIFYKRLWAASSDTFCTRLDDGVRSASQFQLWPMDLHESFLRGWPLQDTEKRFAGFLRGDHHRYLRHNLHIHRTFELFILVPGSSLDLTRATQAYTNRLRK